MRRIMLFLAALGYLAAMAYFAFRPFRPIPGLQYASADPEWGAEGVHVQRDAALEDPSAAARLRPALVASGAFSLVVELRTDSLKQYGPASIVTLSRNAMNRNFTLGQHGDGLVFRLLTSRNGRGGMLATLQEPHLFATNTPQRLAVTFDRATLRLYAEGVQRRTLDVEGDFSGWGSNRTLVLGDEPDGGDGWAGWIRSLAFYDRALAPEEVASLAGGQAVPGALLAYDFAQGGTSTGMVPLRYRNLFVSRDPAAYELGDCLFNIAGFVPLGLAAYLCMPLRMERRKLAAVAAPLVAGLVASGTIEWLQRYVDGRVPCTLDLVYNTMGALLGGLLGWLVFSTFEERRIKRSKT